MNYNVTKEEEKIICDMIDKFLKTAGGNTLEFPTTLGVSPYMLSSVLENNYGYEETNIDSNGGDWDFWWNYENTKDDKYPNKLFIEGTGASFELYLRKED